MKTVVELQGVSKIYQMGRVAVPALRNVNLAVFPGEFLAITGPSGSGKTTLLNLVGCIDMPTSGTVKIQERIISYNGLSRLHKLRLQTVGFIFQSFNLVPVLTAYENVEYPLLLTSLSASQRKQRVRQVLEEVELWDVRHHKPKELSGGQRQRVAIARALVNRPCIVLADEPTANLDSQTSRSILALMQELNHEENVTVITTTHDPLVLQFASRQIELRDGQFVASGQIA